ncbi:MAG: hypothetical protein CEN87_630 [Parcubacteria group bacterium Licking1014_1]|nr:MAG: hypothetical protein CEN87_630 [Parcubacteria group bacterium Licking1014_1]
MEGSNILVIILIIIVSIAGLFALIWFNQSRTPESKLNNMLDKISPDFSFYDLNGKNYSLENLKGKNVVLFFSEGIRCYPACWNQIAFFGSDVRFNAGDITVLSVVIDSPEDWKKVINKIEGLDKAIIAIDKNGLASKKFGMLTLPSSMKYGSQPGHTYVILDKQGIVRYVFDDPRMAVNSDQIFNEILKLNK